MTRHDAFHVVFDSSLARLLSNERLSSLFIFFSFWQDANIIRCLCVWIITSVDNATAAEATKHIQGSVENHEWDLHDLSAIWKMFLRKQKSKTLMNGFQLFLKVMTYLSIFCMCLDLLY